MKEKLFYTDYFLSILLFLATSTITNASTQYVISGLGTAQNFSDAYSIGINSSGNTVGSSGDEFDGLTRGFYNIAGGAPVDIPFLSGYFYNWAVAINDNNQVAVNDRVTIDTGYGLSIYDIDTNTSTNLGGGSAIDINNNGTILGSLSNSITLFTVAGNTTVTGFNNYRTSRGNAINNNGAFTGYVQGDIVPATQAYLYSNNTVTELGTLPGAVSSLGQGLNDLNQVVGSAQFRNNGISSARPFLWENGVMSNLGILEGDDSAGALSINNLGQIIGTSRNTSAGHVRPFIYQNGIMTALEDLIINGTGWYLDNVTEINDSGQITGVGSYGFDQITVLLTPVLSGDISPRSAPDGVVNVGDLLLLTRMVLGLITYSNEELILADLNSDATLDAGDIVLMSQILFGS